MCWFCGKQSCKGGEECGSTNKRTLYHHPRMKPLEIKCIKCGSGKDFVFKDGNHVCLECNNEKPNSSNRSLTSLFDI
mgnify:CR=1 FL=1